MLDKRRSSTASWKRKTWIWSATMSLLNRMYFIGWRPLTMTSKNWRNCVNWLPNQRYQVFDDFANFFNQTKNHVHRFFHWMIENCVLNCTCRVSRILLNWMLCPNYTNWPMKNSNNYSKVSPDGELCPNVARRRDTAIEIS